MNLETLLLDVVNIAKAASTLIMQHYANPITHEKKADDSPVTIADEESNALIVAALQQLTPKIPVVSEEGDQPPLDAEAMFWLVDPLDGTKSYIGRDAEFSVNIALIKAGEPVLGVLAVPAKELYYWAVKSGKAWRQSGNSAAGIIRCRVPPMEGWIAVTSKAYGQTTTAAFLEQYPIAERIRTGSAYKFARVAEGSADFYPRLGPTMEWDTAAGQCLVEAAGGSMTTLDGQPFRYGKPGYLNDGFLVFGVKSRTAYC